METITLTLTPQEVDTIIDSLSDRLESVEELISFEESQGNTEDAEILSEVYRELEELLEKL